MVATEVEIVPMRRRHLRGVVAIEDLTNPRPWSYDLFESELKQVSSRSFVAIAPHSLLVGFACLMTTGFETHVTNLGVDPQRRREGIARHLVQRLLDETRTLGLDDVTLEVREGNAAARALYRSFGFVDDGVRPRYYAESNEDAVIMWRRGLGPGADR